MLAVVLGRYPISSWEIAKAVGRPTVKLSYYIEGKTIRIGSFWLIYLKLNCLKLLLNWFCQKKTRFINKVQRPTLCFCNGQGGRTRRYFPRRFSSSSNISPQSYSCSFTCSVYFQSICCKYILDICLLAIPSCFIITTCSYSKSLY